MNKSFISTTQLLMKILITGADGLLGSNLVRLLISQGHTIRVFLQTTSKSKTLQGLDIEKYYGDILVVDSIMTAMRGCDIVIHAAANTCVWPAKSSFIRKINTTGTENMITVAKACNIKRFIYVGTASSIKSASANNQTKMLDYIDSKTRALNLVLQAAETNALDALAILPTYMVGAYDSLPSSGKMILSLIKGQLKFCSKGGKNFVYVNDVATAISNAIAIGISGKYYIAGNQNLTYQEFLQKVATISGKPANISPLPDFFVKTIGAAGSLYGAIFKKAPLLSLEMAQIGCEKYYYNSNDAVKQLLMPQTPIDKAISDCVQWFKQEGYC